MTTENVGGESAPMDDAAMFDALASGQDLPEESPEVVAETPQPEAEAVAQEPEQQAPVVEQPQQDNRVPLRELLDEREKRQTEQAARQAIEREVSALRRQIESLQPKTPEPEFWENPESTIESRVSQAEQRFQQQLMAQREAFSKMHAVDKYGSEAVDAAYADMSSRMQSDPSAPFEYQRIMASPHPWGELVAWHKRQSLMKEIGDDPSAYHERLLSDQAFLAKALERARASAQQSPSVVNLPNSQRTTTSLPSVSKMGAAAPIGRQGADDLDDGALWDSLARPARKK